MDCLDGVEDCVWIGKDGHNIMRSRNNKIPHFQPHPKAIGKFVGMPMSRRRSRRIVARWKHRGGRVAPTLS